MSHHRHGTVGGHLSAVGEDGCPDSLVPLRLCWAPPCIGASLLGCWLRAAPFLTKQPPKGRDGGKMGCPGKARAPPVPASSFAVVCAMAASWCRHHPLLGDVLKGQSPAAPSPLTRDLPDAGCTSPCHASHALAAGDTTGTPPPRTAAHLCLHASGMTYKSPIQCPRNGGASSARPLHAASAPSPSPSPAAWSKGQRYPQIGGARITGVQADAPPVPGANGEGWQHRGSSGTGSIPSPRAATSTSAR